jgi:hypothetical protein
VLVRGVPHVRRIQPALWTYAPALLHCITHGTTALLHCCTTALLHYSTPLLSAGLGAVLESAQCWGASPCAAPPALRHPAGGAGPPAPRSSGPERPGRAAPVPCAAASAPAQPRGRNSNPAKAGA